jgi:cell division protein FtsL
MKGSSLKSFIVIVASVSLVLLSYVVIGTEIRRITGEKIMKHNILNERQNRIDTKLVEIQKLTAEDRIVRMAQDSLGLIRPEENLEIIPVSKDQIVQIEKLLKIKYE